MQIRSTVHLNLICVCLFSHFKALIAVYLHVHCSNLYTVSIVPVNCNWKMKVMWVGKPKEHDTPILTWPPFNFLFSTFRSEFSFWSLWSSFCKLSIKRSFESCTEVICIHWYRYIMITLIQTKQRIIIHQIFPTTNETLGKMIFFFWITHFIIRLLQWHYKENNYKSRK